MHTNLCKRNKHYRVIYKLPNGLYSWISRQMAHYTINWLLTFPIQRVIFTKGYLLYCVSYIYLKYFHIKLLQHLSFSLYLILFD